jgi:hypothetical protein
MTKERKPRRAIVPSEKGQHTTKPISLSDVTQPNVSPITQQPNLRVIDNTITPKASSALDIIPGVLRKESESLEAEHARLHKEYHKKSLEPDGGMIVEDIVNLHSRIVDELYKRGIAHPYPPDVMELDDISGTFEVHVGKEILESHKSDNSTPEALAGTESNSAEPSIIPSMVKGENAQPNAVVIEDAVSEGTEQQMLDPYEVLPCTNESHRLTLHHHWCGKSVHVDLLIETSDETALNWEIQPPGGGDMGIEVEDLSKAESIQIGLDLMDIQAGLKAIPKMPVAKGWLDAHGVTKMDKGMPPPLGGSTKHPGVYCIVSKGSAEFGAQTSHIHEYFIQVEQNVAKIVFTKSEQGWKTTENVSVVPFVLSKQAVEDNWVPKVGHSALPATISKQIPEKYQYWAQPSEEISKTIRDSLYRAINIGQIKLDYKPKVQGMNKDSQPNAEIQFDVSIAKIVEEKRLVYGIVLEPDEVDAQNDTISAEVIEKAAHNFIANYNKETQLGYMHKVFGKIGIELVQSYVALHTFKMGSEKVKKGSWVMVTHVTNDQVWNKIKKGTITGYSIGGLATVV